MNFKWTESQQEAVNAPISDILVTAAAGSGKTQVLTGRIIERLLNGADITRILVVTFTNAAASEMRSRISENLSNALRDNPKNTHIREQLACLSSAHITTMHSFCMDILKRNFYMTELNAGFRVADASEASLLILDSADEAIENLYRKADSSFLTFADSFSSIKSDVFLSELAVSMYYFADGMPYPEKWLHQQSELYEMTTSQEFKESLICKTLLIAAKEKLHETKGILSAAKQFCTPEDGLEDYNLMFANDIICVDGLISACDDYDKLRAALSGFAFTRRQGAKEASEEHKSQLADMRQKAKTIIDDLLTKYFPYSSEENAKIMHDTLPIIKGAITLVLNIIEIFTQKKRKRNILDYSDMEHIVLTLLDNEGKPSKIAEDIKSSFDEIYIDEYQDTGEMEDLIFSLISGRADGNPNVFMVGDLKQSIYGFRQSSPALFAQKKKTYKIGDKKYRKIALTKNFRSSDAIIDFVNHIFTNLMSENIGGVDYDCEEQLVMGTKYPEVINPVEVAVINVNEAEVSDELFEEEANGDIAAIEAEALYIAGKINNMVGKEFVFDAKRGVSRRMKYNDIAIITRSAKGTAPSIESVLTDAGIPVYFDGSEGYFETSEIKGMLALLSTIDNPRNDIPLISTLRIPTIGFNEDILASIRCHKKRGDFYDAIKACAETDIPEGVLCKTFMKKLLGWRFLSEHIPCDELIERLYADTGYMDFALSMPGGEMRAANLRLLAERARAFEKTSFRGLFNFINFISKMREKSDTSSAKIIGEGHDVVRLMTIHKSKGLEFPVVILAGCGKRFNRRDEWEKLTFHKKLGIGTDFVDTSLRCSYPTPAKAAVAAAKRADSVSEELRVLYVALTRPKQRLIITATTKNHEKTIMSWKIGASLIKSGGYSTANSYLDWIGACLYNSNCPNLSAYCEKENGEGSEILFGFYPVSRFGTQGNPLNKSDESKVNTEILVQGFNYQYPHKNLALIPSKISVSEMKRLQRDEIENEVIYNPFAQASIKKPRFIKEQNNLSSTEKGNLVHFVMQTIPLPVNCIDDIKKHVASLLKRRIISEKMASAVPFEKIFAFFDSHLGKRMMSSEKVVREKPFTDYISAELITKNENDKDEKVLVQGIIDCFFFENNKIILLDYKTDKVKTKALIKESYKLQIETYAAYLEKKYLKECEKFIYLFDINDIIHLHQ